jgi:CrcB protein
MNNPATMTAVLKAVFLVGAGGALGSLARYGTSVGCARLFGTQFPWGTLLVNLVGCFIYGLAFALIVRNALPLASELRMFLLAGFLGGFTTFSSFGMETVLFAAEGAAGLAVVNILANNVAGLALCALGLWAGRLL